MAQKRKPSKYKRISLYVRLSEQERRFIDDVRLRYPGLARSKAMEDALVRFMAKVDAGEAITLETLRTRRNEEMVIRGYTVDNAVTNRLTDMCERRMWHQSMIVRVAIAHLARDVKEHDAQLEEDARSLGEPTPPPEPPPPVVVPEPEPEPEAPDESAPPLPAPGRQHGRPRGWRPLTDKHPRLRRR
ncbi:hypothetical protein [Marinivivus vitaminiproducens]|uniref:hypothetical protein n=1 Tax=Marinivivus vitaminiproducens TaxID=3035935 RepID=UPI002798D8AE|nr:hypothetical protein P4R82_24640 [Geminicoccaceae bacterium SCSIO 64248]